MRKSKDYPPDHRAAMEALYKNALASDVTSVGVDWLYRAHLLLEIAGDDPIAARNVIHTDAGREAAGREYESLNADERVAIGAEVGMHWGGCLKWAIERLWHACNVLEIDPTTLNVDMVALHAATLLSERPHGREGGEVNDA